MKKRILTPLAFVLALLLSTLNFSEIDFLYGPGYGATVIAISDGDTITVRKGKRRHKEKIRLYGIDCPEKLQEYGSQAKLRTSTLTVGQLVSIIPVHTDRYGRTVAYVILPDGRNLNYTLVSEGYAWWYRNYAKRDVQFAFREIMARTQKKGLWTSEDAVAPWDFRKGVSISSTADDDAL